MRSGWGAPSTADQMRFGPVVQWIAATEPGAEDCRVDPALPAGALQPACAGNRPKLSDPGQALAERVASMVRL